jgi:diguanylate cyclase (GGDEF)-like protein
MTDLSSNTEAANCEQPAGLAPPVEPHLFTLSSLLGDLDDAAAAPATGIETSQNELVQVRLGIASALFVALQAKHPPTAAHCLRVALRCSSWSMAMGLGDQQRDEIEVAALLHDLGKIGVPDRILRKPGTLSQNEATLMARHRLAGMEILSACCAASTILEIVEYCGNWYDGSWGKPDRCGPDLPLGARMIAIVDAYDAMTTDSLYRKSLSRERAEAELFERGGSQFDPELVVSFADFLSNSLASLETGAARRWLRQLSPQHRDAPWRLVQPTLASPAPVSPESVFQQALLDNMHDGVIFVDESLRIFHWNRGAERLTGIAGNAACDRQWAPELISLQDMEGLPVVESDCPVLYAVRSGVQSFQRCRIRGRRDEPVTADVHVVAVLRTDGTTRGAILLLRDVSSEDSLQQRVVTLHAKATQDALTQVANRAEFDRLHTELIRTHLDQLLTCSLIMCDIDKFKDINDRYGHQAGDEALTRFAAQLRQSCRQGDLVARYGGEEFVVLCADCGNSAATQRAEEIRRKLMRLPFRELGGRNITASFGVTELQSGDTADAMLRRADRALLEAKRLGRNRVVQLGSGMNDPSTRDHADSGSAARPASGWLIDERLVTSIPLRVAAKKLRGFVADHQSDIVSIDNNRVVLRADARQLGRQRRRDDRPVSFVVDLTLTERHGDPSPDQPPSAGAVTTMVHVIIRPQRWRDRRSSAADSARHLLDSLASYLMARPQAAPPEHGQS